MHGGIVRHARISFYRAVYGEGDPPIGERRLTKPEQFKAKRAALKSRKGPEADSGACL
jgi:hypothetical protein